MNTKQDMLDVAYQGNFYVSSHNTSGGYNINKGLH